METAKGLIIAGLLFLASASLGIVAMMDMTSGVDAENEKSWTDDPLIQGEEHDHRETTQHNMSSSNIEFADFNELTTPGNAEVQVMSAPDGRVYAYQAGWNDVHITDVTDPTNTTVVGVYHDPNTQVLDVKYIEYNGNEFLILQNQLVDTGYADPNVGNWDDPVQVSVTLIDVTDKTNPHYVDSWYDVDHPSGPHNLYTQMI
ncbi:MAG: hypothetical protein OSB32_06485, partial [Candidatus Poseidoniales archaeon]|nr:hypothetical protein [Candidatus Poseidoniales archaeon]